MELTIVRCMCCEWAGIIHPMRLENAYPVQSIAYVPIAGATPKQVMFPGYLCKTHYDVVAQLEDHALGIPTN